jgi:uncharacterized damage-inducible protein DinB
MTRLDALLTELTHETATARRHLERLPDAHFDWRPHPKSFTAGRLACHIVDCVRWTPSIFSADELDLDERPYRPFLATSVASLLEGFDVEVDTATRAMASAADTGASLPWRLKMRGKVWFEKPREDVFRDMTLSHLIHHRGQLSVYLRLLDVPVPGSYGPTADDRP